MTDDATNIIAEPNIERKPLDLCWSDYKWPLLFLLSMSMIGLFCPLGYLLVPILLINRFKQNRYDFLIMLTIVLGGFGFTAEGSYPVKTWDIAFLLSIILILIHRNRGVVKKSVIAWFGYCLFVFLIATFSEESLGVQFRLMRYTFMFCYFIVPIACFASWEFDIRKFFDTLMPYIIIICAFYILDGLIICGFVFLPRTPLYGDIPDAFFFSPVVFGFPNFVRKYPQALILVALVIYPIAKMYKLKWWHLVLFLGACMACQTFTVISGFVVGYLVCIVKFRTIIKYIIAVPIVFAAVYFVDSLLPVSQKDSGDESFLRVKSSIDQILELTEMQDDVDFADFGSGRMAQALPKIELVSELNREMTGLGFLHPTLTTNPKYIIDNEYYLDTSKSEEIATKLIEVDVLQVYVTTGWLGLLAYFLFYPLTYIIVCRHRYAKYYLSVLVMTFWFGMGSYGGWIASDGLIVLSLSYGATLLSERKDTW